jgi:hypothetical protein
MFLPHCNFPRCAHLCEVVIHFHIKDENEATLCSVNIENSVNVTRRDRFKSACQSSCHTLPSCEMHTNISEAINISL